MKDYEVDYWYKKPTGEVCFTILIHILLAISGLYVLMNSIGIIMAVIGMLLLLLGVMEIPLTVYYKMEAKIKMIERGEYTWD